MRPPFPHEFSDFGDRQFVTVGRTVPFGHVSEWYLREGRAAGFEIKVSDITNDIYFRRDVPREAA